MLKDMLFKKIKKKISAQDNFIAYYLKKKYVERKRGFISYNCYQRQYEEVKENLAEEFSRILKFSNDYEPLIYEEEFERKIAKYCDCKHAIGMSSGTAALQFYLAALGLSEKDEVISVANTFISTILPVINLGLKPVFVDIKDDDHTINTQIIEEQITERTRLLLPVHIYGNACDMHSLLNISKKYKLPIFEDSAQAFGSFHAGKPSPFTGEGFFSFHTSKNLGGFGNGGIILTNSTKLKNKIKIMKDLSSDDISLKSSKRTPSSLDAIQICFLNAKLPFINAWTKKRRENARYYNEELKNTCITLPIERKNSKNNYHSYVIRSKKRDELQKFLEKNKIETKIEYPLPLHVTKLFDDTNFKKRNLPITEQINKEILSLPINPFLKEEELKKIINVIKIFDKKS